MKEIIITVCDEKSGKQYDVEVPNDLNVENLMDDLLQAIIGYDPDLCWNLSRMQLYSPRKGRYLELSRTLYEEGIWNGDYIYCRMSEG